MNPWLNSAINFVVIVGGCFGLSLCTNPAYALPVQPHVGSGLVASNQIAHIPRLNAVFLCAPFSYTLVMVWLNGEAFAPAGFLFDLSTNPVQSNHPYLVVRGSASINQIGVTP